MSDTELAKSGKEATLENTPSLGSSPTSGAILKTLNFKGFLQGG
jgi:hypothetical protein